MSLLLLATYATLLALGLAAYFRWETRTLRAAATDLGYAAAVVEDAANTARAAANAAAFGSMSKEHTR